MKDSFNLHDQFSLKKTKIHGKIRVKTIPFHFVLNILLYNSCSFEFSVHKYNFI